MDYVSRVIKSYRSEYDARPLKPENSGQGQVDSEGQGDRANRGHVEGEGRERSKGRGVPELTFTLQCCDDLLITYARHSLRFISSNDTISEGH